ncbi:MAG TPA: twin-arginine translocation signal domain-containing protein, partial [Gemmatimonadales bacterium]|nr:twin-arginine translocation signal domain-containing protein [Gemmatimonadales bacterium]
MTPPPDHRVLTRRELLKTAGAVGAAMAVTPRSATAAVPAPIRPPGVESMMGVPFARHDKVRLAIVGTGLRGTSVLREWL